MILGAKRVAQGRNGDTRGRLGGVAQILHSPLFVNCSLDERQAQPYFVGQGRARAMRRRSKSQQEGLRAAVGYVRVSTEGQVAQGVSLEAQRARIGGLGPGQRL